MNMEGSLKMNIDLTQMSEETLDRELKLSEYHLEHYYNRRLIEELQRREGVKNDS